jgi:hypothetical protein
MSWAIAASERLGADQRHEAIDEDNRRKQQPERDIEAHHSLPAAETDRAISPKAARPPKK